MKRLILSLIAIILAGCNHITNAELFDREPTGQREDPGIRPGPTHTPSSLENFGPAPELKNDVWLNTENPLRLADLRGKVVLLDMWTFG
jgi:hypothetical protein